MKMNADIPAGNESTVEPPLSEDQFDDVNTDEESPAVHDQLPSPEEYKANMTAGSVLRNNAVVDNPQDGDDVHDQLPSVDEYKANMSFKKGGADGKKSRAGLYTFLALFLVTIVVTAIAVPVALKKEGKGKSTTAAASNNGSSGSVPTPARMTGYPVRSPTRAPVNPPETSRMDKTIEYLTNYGLVTRSLLNDDETPQAMAAKWIANEDEYKLDIPTFSNGNNGEPYSATRFGERYALAVFYYSTGGTNWRYQLNFMKPVDHCEWFDRFVDPTGSIIKMGVTMCEQYAPNFDGKKVAKVEISNNKLTGVIPIEIKFLNHLSSWITPFNADLVRNDSLEPFLASSKKLAHLELQYCGLTGTIPENFGELTNLTFLGLGNNFLSGTIPESFFGLENLVVLGMDDNLLESPIAPFGKLSKIEKLYVEDNGITGQITEDIVEGWKSMVDLDLSANRLEGPIPANIWSLTDLEVVDLHGNDFIGEIPPIPSVHENMFFFAVQNNNLDWRIPESIDNLVNLKHLDVSANRMAIPFPSTMGKLTNLVALYTGINGFDEHPIPDFLASLTNLRELSMKQNQLIGRIPAFLGDLTDLQVLDLDFNKLTGNIPGNLGSLTGLDTLMLNRNYLEGVIPSSFSNLVDIDILLLDSNNITGNADVICESEAINTTAFIADCGEDELECSCCTLCCADTNTTCNNFDWNVNLDGIWEYDFQRVVYSFSQEILPASAKLPYTKPYSGVAEQAEPVPEAVAEFESTDDDNI